MCDCFQTMIREQNDCLLDQSMTTPQWFRTAKNLDASSGLLACPFAPLTPELLGKWMIHVLPGFVPQCDDPRTELMVFMTTPALSYFFLVIVVSKPPSIIERGNRSLLDICIKVAILSVELIRTRCPNSGR